MILIEKIYSVCRSDKKFVKRKKIRKEKKSQES